MDKPETEPIQSALEHQRQVRRNSRLAASMFCGIAIEIPALPALATGIATNQQEIIIPAAAGSITGLGLCVAGLVGLVCSRR